MKAIAVTGLAMVACTAIGAEENVPYAIVDTGQIRCYDDHTEIQYPTAGKPFFGQDAEYNGNQPAYRDNGDGTVTDLNTGLMWQADPGTKMTYAQAVAGAAQCRTGGYNDWRLPTIKELYSLILFNGTDPDPRSRDPARSTPFIDTRHFKFQYGDMSDGDRIIDSQWATSTLYGGKVMCGQQAMFGVNFADGRIKGYPTGNVPGRGAKTFYVVYVRGNKDYGKNDFMDNSDGTVTDRATGLTWQGADSGRGMNWQEAFDYAENLQLAGHADWRLPNAKELQSIVDYSRSPNATESAAIDPIFECTEITNEDGEKDYGHYWSSTTHVSPRGGNRAVYVAFGRALGLMHGQWMDVHGAGAQRSDQKAGDESRLPQGHGPQGDAQRIYDMVRCVRGGTADPRTNGPALQVIDSSRRPTPSGSWQGHPNGRPSGADFVRRLDRDGDGKVSLQEFDGPNRHFSEHDGDGDGYLIEFEAPPPPPAPRHRQEKCQEGVSLRNLQSEVGTGCGIV